MVIMLVFTIHNGLYFVMVTIYNIINIMVIDYGYVFTNILYG